MNNDRRQGHLSKVFGGDTFVNLYSHQKTSTPYMKKSCARWQVFPVESYVNTDMRSGLALTNGDTEVGKELNKAPYSNDWFYNSVYSQEGNTKGALMVDENVPENLKMYFYFSWIRKFEISSKMGIGFSWDQNWILYEFISNMAVLKVLGPVELTK